MSSFPMHLIFDHDYPCLVEAGYARAEESRGNAHESTDQLSISFFIKDWRKLMSSWLYPHRTPREVDGYLRCDLFF